MASNSAESEFAKLMAPSEKLYMSHLLTGNRDDIQGAVHCARDVFDQVPPNDPSMPTIQYNLARSLFRNFLDTRQVEDITLAIEMFRQASQARPRAPMVADDGMREKCFQYLVISSFLRDGDLDEFLQLHAPDVASQSLSPSPQIKNLTHNLEEDEVFRYLDKTLFKSQGRLQENQGDLDSAIELCRKALEFFSGHFIRIAKIFFHLGVFLRFRHSSRKRAEDNNEAASCFCSALRVGLPLHMVQPCLTFACNAFMDQFVASRWHEHLDNAVDYVQQAKKMLDAIEYAEQSLSMASPNVQGSAVVVCLDTLARVMRLRYMATGDLNELNSAIGASIRAVATAEGGDPRTDFPTFLNNLAENLKLRIQRTGDHEDVRLAIEMLERAVNLWPPSHPRRIESLINLSCFESIQSRNLLDGEYGERAVHHLQEAVSIIKQEPGLRRGLDISFLGSMVPFVLSNFSDLKWSEEAEALARSNVASDSLNNQLENFSYAILYSCHLERWNNTHEIKEIDGAISIARSMMNNASRSSSDELISAWIRLGHCLYARYKSTGDNENANEAVAVLLKGFRRSAGAPSQRMRAGKVAIEILSELADWVRARKFCRDMINLLVLMNGHSSDWQDRQLWLRQFSSEAGIYASIALQAGSDAWEVIDMLETCRSSILSYVTYNRTDLVDLKKAAPEKVEHFRMLRDEFNAVIDPSGNMSVYVEQIARREKAYRNIRALLDEIRKLENFRQFFLGPSQEEVTVAAARGPILIVNVSCIRSDAIIITKDVSVVLPLPGLEYEKAKDYIDADLTNFSSESAYFADYDEKNTKFRQLQEWLWENCVKLILAKLDNLLGPNGPAKRHVWWIGIGIAESLPFHAAGTYTAEESRATALSGVISSYTPTLKLLIHSRGKLRSWNNRPQPDTQGLRKMAIIIMPSTPGKGDLEGVVRESEAVFDIVSARYSPTIISQPDAEVAKKLTRECSVTHFACYGESILIDPSSSHLLLQVAIPNSAPAVDKLTVRDVAIASERSNCKLIFLSARSTVQRKLTAMWDAVLLLASGFQVAVCSHVVGNLWFEDDEKSVQLVKGFYQHLVDAGELGDGENVAKALNEALCVLAKKHAREPLSWAQYVHFGVC